MPKLELEWVDQPEADELPAAVKGPILAAVGESVGLPMLEGLESLEVEHTVVDMLEEAEEQYEEVVADIQDMGPAVVGHMEVVVVTVVAAAGIEEARSDIDPSVVEVDSRLAVEHMAEEHPNWPVEDTLVAAADRDQGNAPGVADVLAVVDSE